MPWVGDQNVGLLTDLYELTMAEAYLAEDLSEKAVFSLFYRRLPARRNFLLACGLDDALGFLQGLQFDERSLAYLESLGLFSKRLLDWLRAFHFEGDVFALPEGTPVFPNEPLLEVVAPIAQAQLVETAILNQVHLQTVAASKAARMAIAARGRTVMDFGARRAHGADASIKVARAAYIAGLDSTSNVLAGRLYGVPVAGTMAHSYVQAHRTQLDAFRAFARTYPKTILLVDTYDTLEGVRDVVRLARELGPGFQVQGVRLDSGDLLALSREARKLLDEAGLPRVQIVASGGLDENEIDRLVRAGAPISGFGVGSALAVSQDAPCLDMAYKLVAYGGTGRIKLSPGKVLLPGRKQVFRVEQDGVAHHDVLAGHEEEHPGRALLVPVMRGGRRLMPGPGDLHALRRRARQEIEHLPEPVRGLAPATPPYPVETSPRLIARRDELALKLGVPLSDSPVPGT
ncbi:MAG: nicotinate phosphoribosyltransferase [Myxococcaceae bacterium]